MARFSANRIEEIATTNRKMSDSVRYEKTAYRSRKISKNRYLSRFGEIALAMFVNAIAWHSILHLFLKRVFQ